MKFSVSGLLLLLSSFQVYALPDSTPVPGGIYVAPLDNVDSQTQVLYRDRRVAIDQENGQAYAVIGIPLSTKPGKSVFEIRRTNQAPEKKRFVVKKKTYKAQYLTIKNKRKVNPSKQDLNRIYAESRRKKKAKSTWSDTPVHMQFIVPVEGRISSIFGLRRFFNNQPRRPHSGLDIAAPEGTPVKAIESGRVIDTGNFFFSGNMIYIDHGQGIISLYAHLHRIDVKPGDEIKKGQIIGLVGMTGRVTGPHLHLGLFANQTLVDPLLVLPPLQDELAHSEAKH